MSWAISVCGYWDGLVWVVVIGVRVIRVGREGDKILIIRMDYVKNVFVDVIEVVGLVAVGFEDEERKCIHVRVCVFGVF